MAYNEPENFKDLAGLHGTSWNSWASKTSKICKDFKGLSKISQNFVGFHKTLHASVYKTSRVINLSH